MSYDPYQQNPVQQPIGRTNETVALEKVKPPGILMIISGTISTLTSVVGGCMSAAVPLGMNDEVRQEMLRDPQVTPEIVDAAMAFYLYTGIGSAVLGLIFGIVVIVGAIRMLGLRSWGLGLSAAIISMIPCLQGCCLFSIPVGIYALVILCDPQVKSAFK